MTIREVASKRKRVTPKQVKKPTQTSVRTVRKNKKARLPSPSISNSSSEEEEISSVPSIELNQVYKSSIDTMASMGSVESDEEISALMEKLQKAKIRRKQQEQMAFRKNVIESIKSLEEECDKSFDNILDEQSQYDEYMSNELELLTEGLKNFKQSKHNILSSFSKRFNEFTHMNAKKHDEFKLLMKKNINDIDTASESSELIHKKQSNTSNILKVVRKDMQTKLLSVFKEV